MAAFLSGGGVLGRLIADFDWSTTALGALHEWPSHVRVATATMLRSPVPIVMLWGERGVMIYNDAYSVFAGLRHPRLLGSEVRLGWPEVADFNDNVMKVGLAGGTLNYQDQELTLYRNNRSEQVWMNLDYSPLLDETGRPVGVMAIVVETTDKVHALRSLHSQNERMAQLFEQAPSFMAMLQGPTHRYVMANPSYLRLVGNRDVVGKTVAQALPEVVAQGYIELLDRVYATGETFAATGAKYVRQLEPGKPEEVRFVDFVFQPVRNPAGAVDGVFVEGVDVTDRVLADMQRERMVRLAEIIAGAHAASDVEYGAARLLGEALQASRVGYGSIDLAAETLFMEGEWCAAGIPALPGQTPLHDYGFVIDDLRRGALVVVTDVREDPRTQAVAQALEVRGARAFVNIALHEYGRLVAVFFVSHSQPRIWTAEELEFTREVGQRTRTASERVRSDTALRASEARLREANETLEAKVAERTRALMEIEAQYRQSQKMEAIGQLTGGIAHDFNNLLHSMSMSLEILKRSLKAGRLDNFERYLDVSLTSVRRAASLTHRLLAFSRRQTLDPQPIDVEVLLRGMEELVRGTVGPAISVRVDTEPGLWMTLLDAPQLENAVLNLCINARDAMPQGGQLTLAAANATLTGGEGAVRDLAAGDYVMLTVRDSGTGMSPEVASRAFDPFFTTKAQGQGTGLGLSMVYGFVRQSGGEVLIDSSPGTGTAMNIFLPRFQGAAAPAAASVAMAPGRRAKGEVVLLVEDERPIRELLFEELQGLGFEVLAVATGAEALELLRNDRRIDLLVTDVGLPGGMSGPEVAANARRDRPAMKVLFITGYAEGKVLGDQAMPESTRVVIKPFRMDDFMSALWTLIDTRTDGT